MTLSFSVKIAKIGPADSEIICFREIIKKDKKEEKKKEITEDKIYSPVGKFAERAKSINQSIITTAAVLASQAEAIVRTVRSLTNMAAADSNDYLKSNYMLMSIILELNITLILTFTCELLQKRSQSL